MAQPEPPEKPGSAAKSKTPYILPPKLNGWDALVWGIIALILVALLLYIQHVHSTKGNNTESSSFWQYSWNWSAVFRFIAVRNPDSGWKAGPLLLGLASTLKLAIYSIILALLLGVPAGILQVQKLRILRLFGQFYVELIRNIPPLVVVTVFYFFFASPLVEWLELEAMSRNAGPTLRKVLAFLFDMGSGQNNLILGNFFAAVIILGIYEGSYIAEIVRAGIQAISDGQHRAATALGLSPVQNYSLVILPQTFRSQLPALTNQFISAIKDSSIVSLISIQELTFRSKQVITTTRAFFESSIALLALYLVLTGLCSLIAGRVSHHYRLR